MDNQEKTVQLLEQLNCKVDRAIQLFEDSFKTQKDKPTLEEQHEMFEKLSENIAERWRQLPQNQDIEIDLPIPESADKNSCRCPVLQNYLNANPQPEQKEAAPQTDIKERLKTKNTICECGRSEHYENAKYCGNCGQKLN